MKIQRVASKWAKTRALLANPSLSTYIPDTRQYSFGALDDMLVQYGTVYIKPDRGTYGKGVMRVESRTIQSAEELSPGADTLGADSPAAQTVYILRHGQTARSFIALEPLHQAIERRMQGHLYLIQKGIALLTHRNRPFDLRVLTQQTPSGRWETTGMLSRVAAANKIVTNYHNGGSILSVEEVLNEYTKTRREFESLENELAALGIRIARQLERHYPGIKEVGLDVALDEELHPWLLEVNTLPSIAVFKLFPDKSIYRKIHRYAEAYGRVGRAKTSLSRRKPLLRSSASSTRRPARRRAFTSKSLRSAP